MYERFTDRARLVLRMANDHAREMKHDYVESVHLLFALVKERGGAAAKVLKSLEIDLLSIACEVQQLFPELAQKAMIEGELPLTSLAKRVLSDAAQEALSLNHHYVGTEHILLGLLTQRDGAAAQILMNRGLTLDKVRQEIRRLLGFGLNSQSDSSAQLRALTDQLEDVNRQKEAAVANQDFDRAAACRDQANELLERIRETIRELTDRIRGELGPETPDLS